MSMTGAPNCVSLRDGRFDSANGSNEADLKRIFASFTERRPERLVLHFHGGLVSREDALASARRLAPEYEESGAESLFVIWESGVQEVISQKLPKIFEENLFRTIHVKVSQFVKAKLEKLLQPEGARGPGFAIEFDEEIQQEIEKGPGMFSDILIHDISTEAVSDPENALTDDEKKEIESKINRDPTLKRELRAIEAARSPDGSGDKSADIAVPTSTLMDEDVLDSLATPAEEGGKFALSAILVGKHIVWIVGAAIWRFVKRRDHGVYLTIIEEIMREFYVRAVGRSLWTGMKESIEHAFQFEPDCGGTALVREMQALWASGARPCVTLVGHSAGAIYVARLLRALHGKMDQGFKANVVLIAPACTFADFAPALDQAGGCVANLRIFGMTDTVERKDAIANQLYPASLLYFVSGVLEDDRDQPLAGMERYYSAPYIGEGFGEIAFVKGQATLSRAHAYAWSLVSGTDGANCDMTRHGGWADAPATLESIKYLIKKGCDHAW
jgi:hypothetical protein